MNRRLLNSGIMLLAVMALMSCSTNTPPSDIVSIPKSRIVVLTDMLNEADDSQTLVHLLVYANKLDVEGLIAVTSCHQYKGRHDTIEARNDVHPEEITKGIMAYDKVLGNLMLHESGWPSAEYLLGKVAQGPSGFGMSDVGEGKSTTGSKLIIDALKKMTQDLCTFVLTQGQTAWHRHFTILRKALIQLSFIN